MKGGREGKREKKKERLEEESSRRESGRRESEKLKLRQSCNILQTEDKAKQKTEGDH